MEGYNIFNEIAEFIETRYANARKIIEVGFGGRTETAIKLAKKINAEIILTDVNPDFLNTELNAELKGSIRVVIDDIFNPNWKLYEKANLIYAIRPNPELQKQIIDVASKSGADALLKVLSDEWPETENMNMKHEVINYKGVILHFFRKH
ncbi:MAG: UPF0146 family protein [Candidatus Jordarchaeales archaeon]